MGQTTQSELFTPLPINSLLWEIAFQIKKYMLVNPAKCHHVSLGIR